MHEENEKINKWD